MTFTIGGLFSSTYQTGHPNLQAADNQCAPAALANELAWLSANEGLNIPDPNIPGRGQPSNSGLFVLSSTAGVETTGTSLVGELDLAMGRASTSRTSGATTTGTQQLTGLWSYLGSARVNDQNSVVVTYQGNIQSGYGASYTQSGITATGTGLAVTASYIYSQLAAGDTVKLGVTGHAEDVIGAGMVLGVPWLILDSDRAQTPIDANDNNLGANPAIFVWDVNNTLYGEPAGTVAINDISMQVVPEPSSTAMLACGFAGVGLLARRRCCLG